MADGAREPERRSLDVADLLKYIGSPIAVGTALLFYFGWVRSNAQAEAFGVDISVFEMSTDDLILRSINVLFYPLIVSLLGGLLFLRVHPWLRDRARHAAPVLRQSWILVLVGLASIAVDRSLGGLLLPVWVLLAFAGMAYGSRLARHALGDDRPAPLAQSLLLGALLVVILFWVTERFARVGGSALAYELQRDLGGRSPVSLFSQGRLHIDADGVTEIALSGPESHYGYRYDGLYLLQRSGGKYFLLTDGWRDGMPPGRLVILPDDQRIRLEFGPRPSATSSP
jgi:hypothetical protein